MVCREPLLAAGDARHCHCREELPEEQLWWSYATPVHFERLVRAHLEDVVVRRAGQASAAPAARERPRAPVRFNLARRRIAAIRAATSHFAGKKS